MRGDKEAVERQLQDVQRQLHAVEHGQPMSKKSKMSTAKLAVNDDVSDDDEKTDDLISKSVASKRMHDNSINKYNNDDDPDSLSDADSDVVEMKQTIQELRRTQLEYISTMTASSIKDLRSQIAKKNLMNDSNRTTSNDPNIFVRNMQGTDSLNSKMFDPNELFISPTTPDLNEWSTKMTSTMNRNVNATLRYGAFDRYQPMMAQTSLWNNQPTLVTRDAVIKAARTVFAPNVIDQITSLNRPGKY